MATRKTAKTQSAAKRSGKTRVDGMVVNLGSNGDSSMSGFEAAANPPTFAEIQTRAYQRFVARGGVHGDDLADWFAAEKDLMASAPHQ